VTIRLDDVAEWPRPRWLWRLGRPRFLRVGERHWFHDPPDRFFRFFTTPPITVYMPDESGVEYEATVFRRLQDVIAAGGFTTHDLGYPRPRGRSFRSSARGTAREGGPCGSSPAPIEASRDEHMNLHLSHEGRPATTAPPRRASPISAHEEGQGLRAERLAVHLADDVRRGREGNT
jgi:hypothetical protein